MWGWGWVGGGVGGGVWLVVWWGWWCGENNLEKKGGEKGISLLLKMRQNSHNPTTFALCNNPLRFENSSASFSKNRLFAAVKICG